jgi:hypothetical protein
MKKTLLIVIIILVVIIAIPIINLIQWTFMPKKPLDIIIVDKTVPNLDRTHHKSFNWILTNERFVKKNKKTSYSFRKDYFGFYPQRPLRDYKWDRKDYHLKDIIALADSCDAVYFADTYGVFTNDWYQVISQSRKSRILYGGLNNNDYLLIKEMKDRKKLVILEYNTFDYPTVQFESVRTQEKIGITFTGWSGKYFSTLDTTRTGFPIWMTAMYRKANKKPWSFKKSGIVLLREKDIIVMEEGTHLKNSMPHIITDEGYSAKYGVTGTVAFDGWFDIINPLENRILSKFKIETTVVGDTLLAENNLLSQFPAVIQDPINQRMYYFSGDFATSNIYYLASRFKGVDKLNFLLYSDKPDDPRRFFWLYYKPLINGIFTDYYNSIGKKQ